MATVQRIADTSGVAPIGENRTPPPSPARETKLFQEKVTATDESGSSNFVASPTLEFALQAAQIQRLKGDNTWNELMDNAEEKKKVWEFFKYIEATAFAIIRENKIKKGKEELALSMIRFLATSVWDNPDDLKSNLWMARSTKSELREPIAFIVKEFLQMKIEDFDNAEWLSEGEKPEQKKFFDELFGNSDAGTLYKNEHLITLDPLQILVYLAMSYPMDSTPSPSTEVDEKQPQPVKQETKQTEQKPRTEEAQPTAEVKPVRSGSGFSLYKIILSISAIAAAALACTLYFVI